MTTLLRSAWADPAQSADADNEHANGAQACTLQLNAADAASMAGMTLWDMLSGKYQSRVPGMNAAHSLGAARPKWAAWDPCSKYRSRWGHFCCCCIDAHTMHITHSPHGNMLGWQMLFDNAVLTRQQENVVEPRRTAT